MRTAGGNGVGRIVSGDANVLYVLCKRGALAVAGCRFSEDDAVPRSVLLDDDDDGDDDDDADADGDAKENSVELVVCTDATCPLAMDN